MIDYHEAIRQMHKGNVVRFIGTVNGPVWQRGISWCMCRGVVFAYRGEPIYRSEGLMVYDPDYRYELTGETVDPRYWPTDPHKEIKSKMSYSRVGLWGRI
jgi:hypothetical protein